MKEYKIVEFKRAKTTNEDIEKALSELSAEGWEAVSLDLSAADDLRGTVIVLLVRNR
ncbi:MAG: DUF4177 domain-containing protein [Clostridia bacterium]|nr:DUF4177 domain-containing protein [Clostridia bacterium]